MSVVNTWTVLVLVFLSFLPFSVYHSHFLPQGFAHMVKSPQGMLRLISLIAHFPECLHCCCSFSCMCMRLPALIGSALTTLHDYCPLAELYNFSLWHCSEFTRLGVLCSQIWLSPWCHSKLHSLSCFGLLQCQLTHYVRSPYYFDIIHRRAELRCSYKQYIPELNRTPLL